MKGWNGYDLVQIHVCAILFIKKNAFTFLTEFGF